MSNRKEKIIIALHNKLEKKDNIIKYNNSLKAPYEYFKKLNILPVDIVEVEMDKYFTFDELLFEDFKDYCTIGNKNYSWPYNWLCPEFYSDLYHNVKLYFNYTDAKIEYCESKNIPQELITLDNFRDYFNCINILWKIVSEKVKNDFKNDLIYNYDINVFKLNKTIKKLQDKQKKFVDNEKYLIPLDNWEVGSSLWFEPLDNNYLHITLEDYNGLEIVKNCPKTIKYVMPHSSNNIKQIKKDIIKNMLRQSINEFNGYKLYRYTDEGDFVYVMENNSIKLEKIN